MEEQRLHSATVLCGAVRKILCLSELGEGGSMRQCTQILGELAKGMPVNLGEKGLKNLCEVTIRLIGAFDEPSLETQPLSERRRD